MPQNHIFQKIYKYEYLTVEEILPPDQRRVIEQANFPYSPLGKAFEKQTKTIEDQEQKRIKATEEHGKQLIKSSGEKDSLELLKQKETFDELVNEKMFEINKLSEGIDFNNLIYHYTGKSPPKFFVCFKGPLIVYNDIKNGRTSLQEEEKIEEEFQSELNEILKGNLNHKSDIQNNAIKNIRRLYNGQEKNSNFYNDYTRMVSDAKYKSIHGEGPKILTPKQMLQRLPIALAQVKAGHTSENLLNEIRQIIYSLYRATEISKRVYNNILNSIKL